MSAPNYYRIPTALAVLVVVLFLGSFAFKLEPIIAKPPQTRLTPPTIPHSLEGRQGKCLLCHKDAAGVKIKRTPHPERANCIQCHVPN